MENLNSNLRKMIYDPSRIPESIDENSFIDNPKPYLDLLKRCLFDIYRHHKEIYRLPFEDIQEPSLTRLIKDIVATRSIRMSKEFKHVVLDLYSFFQKYTEIVSHLYTDSDVVKTISSDGGILSYKTGYKAREFRSDIDDGIVAWSKYKIPYLSWDYCLDQLKNNPDSPLEIMSIKLREEDKVKTGIFIYPLEFEYHLLLGKVSLKDILTLISIFMIQEQKIRKVLDTYESRKYKSWL